jgi:hypothetical protein
MIPLKPNSILFLGALIVTALATSPTQALDLVEMPRPQNGEYVLSSSVGNPGKGRHWGRPEMVRHLILVAKEWARRHPELPRLRIGDISKFGGGHFPPHKTHQDGLSVDIFTAGQNICHINWKKQELTLELAELFVTMGAKQILYNHPYVIKRLAIVRKWPKHDNHFHVVVDPKKVPLEGEPVVIPGVNSGPGSWIGLKRFDKEKKSFDVRWRILGGSFKIKSAKVQFDDMDDENGVLHDSGPVKAKRSYRVPLTLKDREAYRWRLDLEFEEDKVMKLDWIPLRTDLEAPTILPLGPGDAEEVSGNPTFLWQIEDYSNGTDYRIEISRSKKGRGKKVAGQGRGLSRHVLSKQLRIGKTYYWRVVVADEAGNEGSSDWLSFKLVKPEKTSNRKKTRKREKAEKALKGTVKPSSLNMRKGPGTSHAKVTALPKGTVVKILKEEAGWLEVEAMVSGKLRRGWVSKSYVNIETP